MKKAASALRRFGVSFAGSSETTFLEAYPCTTADDRQAERARRCFALVEVVVARSFVAWAPFIVAMCASSSCTSWVVSRRTCFAPNTSFARRIVAVYEVIVDGFTVSEASHWSAQRSNMIPLITSSSPRSSSAWTGGSARSAFLRFCPTRVRTGFPSAQPIV